MIARPGENCWVRAHADRAAWLIDGEDYFAALADALERAKQRVILLGWDFHSRVRLRRPANGQAFDETQTLCALLNAAVERNRKLRVHILEWDFAVFYAFEREPLHTAQFALRTHRRVGFRTDPEHPPGASHHQKIVAIDDAVAFCGGLDVTSCRWDTSAHAPKDPRRNDAGFPDYTPFHDVHMAVDGEAARKLGELARARWEGATGKRLRPIDGAHDPWPPALEPAFRDATVAIARTLPAWRGRAEVREIETLYLDALRAARDWVLIENQYLSSRRVADALEECLSSEDGPEIVIVTQESCGGWLEEASMGTLRARLLRRLRDAPHAERLRVYYVAVEGLDHGDLTVHSKVCVIDGRSLRIGSANLANRSMGLDSECDLMIEADNDEHAAAIEGFRDTLLGEHLGVDAPVIADAIREHGSLIAAIEALRGGPRSLEVLEPRVPEWVEELGISPVPLDPERPMDYQTLRAQLLPEALLEHDEGAGSAWRLAWTIVALAGLAAAWRWTPLRQWASPEGLAALGPAIRSWPAAPLLAAAAFVPASLAMIPVTALIVASALTFGWLTGAVVAISGALASALAGYAIGNWLWGETLKRIFGSRLEQAIGAIQKRGILAVAGIRLVPIAPFTVVNIAAGSSQLRLRDFALGTLLGMGPGSVLLAAVADRAGAFAADPGAIGALVVIGLTCAFGFASWALRRWLG